jgi:prevent-host-death family protein
MNDHYSDHMPLRVTATEAKARLLALLDDAAAGEEIEITRHGRTVARLVPAAAGHRIRGAFAGTVRISDPNDDLFTATDPADWELD